MSGFYGSLYNRILERGRPPIPKVGDPATVIFYSDREAATIIEVSPSGRKVVVQVDRSIRIDKNGLSEDQRYRFEPDPTGQKRTYTLRRNGRWIEKGDDMRSYGTALVIGERMSYVDPSF